MPSFRVRVCRGIEALVVSVPHVVIIRRDCRSLIEIQFPKSYLDEIIKSAFLVESGRCDPGDLCTVVV